MKKLNYLSKRMLQTLVVGFCAVLVLVSCMENSSASNKSSLALQRVESAKVCMINDKVFADVQIPVVVEGKTYYGCCEMCETKLKTNKESRFAIDPVSKKKVDKATSVIGATKKGKVYYFESEETLRNFEPIK